MRRAMIVVCAAIVLLSACGGRDGREPRLAAAPTSTGVAASSPSPRPVDPDADTGQTVFITDDGFQPQWLLASPEEPIEWRNDTDHVVRIAFDHQPVRSGPIAPGAVFRWTTATPISITYHEVGDAANRGAVQVQTV